MDNDVIRIRDRYYILSTSSLTDDRTRALKHDDTFAVFDRRGDIGPVSHGVQGVFHNETRYLSQWVLRLETQRPLLLSSAVKDDNASLAVDLTNPDISDNGHVTLPRGTLHIARTKFLWKNSHYEQIRVVNYSLSAVEASLSVQFAADFADIFEVRGMHRKRRGKRLKDTIGEEEISLRYRGLDGITRKTHVTCSPKPRRIAKGEIQLDVSLQPRGDQTYIFVVSCEDDENSKPSMGFHLAIGESKDALKNAQQRGTLIDTGNQQYNDWLNRSVADLHMMVTHTSHGPYPYAGIPWFSTPFGRDGIITAMEMLWINPAIARGVLSFLASTQATETNPDIDAEPGKILHETRKGEMAALKEVPFGCYYGSVDSTPLFLMLAGAYYRRTGDVAFIRQIWSNIQKALVWIDEYGDADHDGFVEYKGRSKGGLVQQGWKDSSDSVFHSDGKLAEGPIALCEVQAYVYGAKVGIAEIACALGQAQLSRKLKEQASTLRRAFEESFWCENQSSYALALDGAKRPCAVRASNAGHCLFTGIASRERGHVVAGSLMESDFFSGWGIRTLSSAEVRYNAMSYHNGSIWPHDNALIARGLARYGYRQAVLKILNGLLDASLFFDLHRLPELFCGFDRRPGQGPTLYPVACSPQSWAAGSVFLLIEACLGISIRSSPPTVLFRRTALPQSLPVIRIRNLWVGDASVDLAIQRTKASVDITVLRKEGEVDIVSIK